MNEYFYVVNVISYLFEVYILSIFNYAICNSFRVNRKVRFICYIFAAAILWLLNFFINNTWVNLISVLIISYLLSLMYNMDIKMRCLGIFILFVLIGISEIIIGFILSAIFSDTVMDVTTNILYYTVGVFASKAIMLFGVKLFQLKYKRKDVDLPWGLLIAFSVFPIATLFNGIILIGGFGKETNPTFAFAGSIGTIMLALANILIFYLFERYAKQNKIKYEMETEQTRLMAETAYLQELIKRQQNSSKQMHDLKNQLFAIRQVLNEDTDRGIEEIDKVCATVNGMQNIIYTNDISVDSLINSKIQNLPEKISFKCECYISSFGNIDRIDMCVLLGNLIDNAIEACALVTENPFINLKFLQKGDLINVYISNTCVDKTEGNKTLDTTKPDKNLHGFGLKSIRNIVKKYSGCIDIDCQDSIFTVSLGLYTN